MKVMITTYEGGPWKQIECRPLGVREFYKTGKLSADDGVIYQPAAFKHLPKGRLIYDTVLKKLGFSPFRYAGVA